jgi:hypothetical protein
MIDDKSNYNRNNDSMNFEDKKPFSVWFDHALITQECSKDNDGCLISPFKIRTVPTLRGRHHHMTYAQDQVPIHSEDKDPSPHETRWGDIF